MIMNPEEVNGFRVGSRAEFSHVVTAGDVERFVTLTGDDNPLHVDRDFAQRTPFRDIVAHGMLGASFLSTMIGKHIPGRGALWMSQSIDFLLPVRIGDTLTVVAEVTALQLSQRLLTLKTDIKNQHGQVVVTGQAKVKALEIDEPREVQPTAPPAAIVLVTGASRGIGAATARRLAADGASVVVNYRADADGAQRLVDEITREGKGRAVAAAGDVSSERGARHVVDAAIRHFGGLTGLVVNASHPMVYKTFEHATTEDFSSQLNLQLFGAIHLVRAALPHLQASPLASVVAVTTIAIDNAPPPQTAAYSVAKSALATLMRSLAVEYGPKGVRFNMVAPGMTGTALIANAPDKARQLVRMQTPLRRLAEPADIASAIAYLIGPDSRHVTGETLRICGGAVML